MNGHIVAPFRRRPEPLPLTPANHRHASSGWGEAPLAGGVMSRRALLEVAADGDENAPLDSAVKSRSSASHSSSDRPVRAARDPVTALIMSSGDFATAKA